jgi:uncharacterized protein YdaU (DUF1376 family)
MQNRVSWVKEFPADELQEIGTLSLLERGAYFSLRLIYLTKKCAFFDSKKIHALCFAFTKKEKNTVDDIIEKYFKEGDKYPFNYRLQAIEEQAQNALNQRIEAGKKSAEKRRNKSENNLTTVETTVETTVQRPIQRTYQELRIKKKKINKKKKKERLLTHKEKFINEIGILNWKYNNLSKGVVMTKEQLNRIRFYKTKLNIDWNNLYHFEELNKNLEEVYQGFKILT